MTAITKAIVLAFLVTTFSAKPMQQTFTILEKTSTFLSEFAPEIAVVGGALLYNDKVEKYNPPPMVENVRYTSGSLETDLLETIKDQVITESSKPLNEGGCNPF